MKKYRFKLQNASLGITELAYPPDGWDQNKVIYQRRFENNYLGVFRKRAASVLNFIKNGKDIAAQVEENEGMEGKLTFIVEKLNYSTYEYEEEFRGIADYSSFEDTEEGFSFQVIDSSIEQTLFNRESIPVNLLGTESLDKFVLTGFAQEGSTAILPAREDLYYNFLVRTEDIEELVVPFALPFFVTFQEDDSFKTVTDRTDIAGVDGAFIVADRDTELSMSGIGNLAADAVIGIGTFVATLKRYNGGGVLQESIEVINEIVDPSDPFKEFEYEETMSLLENDYVIMLVNITGITIVEAFFYEVEQQSNTLLRSVSEQQIRGVMFNEAMTRCLQMILSIDDPLYSPDLGRVDSESRSYAEDGDLSLGFVTNGELIRGFDFTETEFTESFVGLFKAFRAIGNVGVGIETIEGSKKVVIRKVKDFFRNFVILEIDNAKGITRKPLPEFIYNRVASGYIKSDYEEKDGRLEYNNKSEYSLPITVFDRELDIVSSIRGDNQGFLSARLKPKSSFPTEDTKYDEDNFILNVVRGANLILNGTFDDWTGNVPDNWVVESGQMLEKEYLGDTRCRFDSLTGGTASISQEYLGSISDPLTFSMIYKYISETPIVGGFGVTITVGGYGLKSDGTWELGYTAAAVLKLLQGSVTEAELQSFDNLSIIADVLPTSGTVKILITSLTEALVIDNVVSGTSGAMLARTNEGFDYITGTVNDSGSFNVAWSPARNMIKQHGWMVRTGLEKQLGKDVVFTKAEKNSNMVSKETGEDEIAESENIVVASLEQSIFKPYQFSFNSEITQTIINTIEDTTEVSGEDIPNFYGIVKFRKDSSQDWKYIWIRRLETEKDHSLGEWLGIEVNLDKVIPIEI